MEVVDKTELKKLLKEDAVEDSKKRLLVWPWWELARECLAFQSPQLMFPTAGGTPRWQLESSAGALAFCQVIAVYRKFVHGCVFVFLVNGWDGVSVHDA